MNTRKNAHTNTRKHTRTLLSFVAPVCWFILFYALFPAFPPLKRTITSAAGLLEFAFNLIYFTAFLRPAASPHILAPIAASGGRTHAIRSKCKQNTHKRAHAKSIGSTFITIHDTGGRQQANEWYLTTFTPKRTYSASCSKIAAPLLPGFAGVPSSSPSYPSSVLVITSVRLSSSCLRSPSWFARCAHCSIHLLLLLLRLLPLPPHIVLSAVSHFVPALTHEI